MLYSIEKKDEAIKLRRKGYSLKEIAEKLYIAKSTASLWLNSIILSQKAQERLKKKEILGQYKSIQIRRNKNEQKKNELKQIVIKALSSIVFDSNLNKLLCSVLFWAEGGKYTDSNVDFINSDPIMVSTFMKLLRQSFMIDENKLRILVHVHEYHDEKDIKNFWSKITNVPLTQFNKSYLKANTKKVIRHGYKGCVRIRYYDYKVARELRMFYNVFSEMIGASVSGRPGVSKTSNRGPIPLAPANINGAT